MYLCTQVFIVLCLAVYTAICQDGVAQYIANNVGLTYNVLDNLNLPAEFEGRIDLTNNGNKDIVDKTWEIYFCSIRLLEPEVTKNFSLAPNGSELGNTRIKVYHVNGCFHKLKPEDDFPGINAGETRQLPFRGADWSAQKTDVTPRWFVTSPTEPAQVISSTAGESLDFVSDFTSPRQWKRKGHDMLNPYTPEVRYNRNNIRSNAIFDAMDVVIPTPMKMDCPNAVYVNVMTGDWQITYTNETLAPEANYLADKLRMEVTGNRGSRTSRYIELNFQNIENQEEGYDINIQSGSNTITIGGTTRIGVFYGIQTLLSLSRNPKGVKSCAITDYPRFGYRGMHLDTSRNFFGKEDIMRLLDAMAMYKMNKFHFHITDDEGWRLEIPGLSEATTIGAQRCFDLNETECIIPQLGSGPSKSTSGTGFYSVADYKEILQYAKDRHIEVIPEFDMPGHSHAIIKAMDQRSKSLGNDSYLLSDPDDESKYLSIQYFKDNAINPCRNSTYDFVRYLVQKVKEIHEDIQPLKIFNFGGDEVAKQAWQESPICDDMVDNNPSINRTTLKTDLQRYFAIRVSEIVHGENLDLAAWEDGLGEYNHPFNRSLLPNDNVYMYAWSNIWEWGGGENAYVFANSDYKVILAHATHLYFDHPQEPDPEERGLYWATRSIDTHKTFTFDAEDVYNNIGISLMGENTDRTKYCDRDTRCVPLDPGKESNIIGIQGHLWSETVRTSEQLDNMIFPRLLAVAERGWHKANWENNPSATKDHDWVKFATALGEKELARLDEMGVKYYIPPPGASISGSNSLSTNTQFPGLTVQYSTDGGQTWSDHSNQVELPQNTEVHLRTRSASGSRYSRVVQTNIPAHVTLSAARYAGNVWMVTIVMVITVIQTISGRLL